MNAGWTSASVKHKPVRDSESAIVLPAGDPGAAADAFARHNFKVKRGSIGLVHYRGRFYRWVGSHYEDISDTHIRSLVYKFLSKAEAQVEGKFETEPYNPTIGKVSQVIEALKSTFYHDEKINPPFHLKGRDFDPSGIALSNGFLNIQTLELRAHSPRIFNTTCLPFDYDPDAPTPKMWLRFLRQLWPDDDDKEARAALREIFGLMLTGDTRYQKIFMLVGPKRSGKGTIGRVLTAMLGKENVVSPTLASFGQNFGLAPLIDKRLAIISDARLGARTDRPVVTERLLSISGEDSQTIDRKYGDHWNGQLGVRFLILTNELPQIEDASSALVSRFVILTLRESFYGKEDPDLTRKLTDELPGILNWALRGLARLEQRGRFNELKSSQDALTHLEDLGSPMSPFLRDWCTVEPDQRVRTKDLYRAWRLWCVENGQGTGPQNVFGRNLKATVPHVTTRGAGVKRFYEGVGFSAEGKRQFRKAGRS